MASVRGILNIQSLTRPGIVAIRPLVNLSTDRNCQAVRCFGGGEAAQRIATGRRQN